MMTPQTKNCILGMAAGVGLFFLIRKVMSKGPNAPSQPKVTQAGISTVLDAYSSAVADGADQSVLNDLNSQTASEYGLRAYTRASDNKVIVTDLSGNEAKAA